MLFDYAKVYNCILCDISNHLTFIVFMIYLAKKSVQINSIFEDYYSGLLTYFPYFKNFIIIVLVSRAG